jgi:type VI secretion system secreted protein Hcp
MEFRPAIRAKAASRFTLTAMQAVGLALILFGTLGDAGAAMFLKLDGINGESQDERHKEEIEVFSWNWGLASYITNTITRVTFQDLTLTKPTDRATPPLILATCNGRHLRNAVLTIEHPFSQQIFYRLNFTNVIVSHFAQAGASGGSATESFGLRFSAIQVEYTEPRSGAGYTAGWDLASNSGGGGTNQTPRMQADLTYTAGSNQVAIAWTSMPGATYRVSFSPSLTQPFTTYGTYPGSTNQETVITVPVTKVMEYFRVEQVP